MFNPDTSFHNKNMHRIWDRTHYIEKLGGLDNIFTKDLDTHGWLLNFINIV